MVSNLVHALISFNFLEIANPQLYESLRFETLLDHQFISVRPDREDTYA